MKLDAASCPMCRSGRPHFGQADWEAHHGRAEAAQKETGMKYHTQADIEALAAEWLKQNGKGGGDVQHMTVPVGFIATILEHREPNCTRHPSNFATPRTFPKQPCPADGAEPGLQFGGDVKLYGADGLEYGADRGAGGDDSGQEVGVGDAEPGRRSWAWGAPRLAFAIAAGSKTLCVDGDLSFWPTRDFEAKVGGEVVFIGRRNRGIFMDCRRGLAGTLPNAHAAGEAVELHISAEGRTEVASNMARETEAVRAHLAPSEQRASGEIGVVEVGRGEIRVETRHLHPEVQAKLALHDELVRLAKFVANTRAADAWEWLIVKDFAQATLAKAEALVAAKAAGFGRPMPMGSKVPVAESGNFNMLEEPK